MSSIAENDEREQNEKQSESQSESESRTTILPPGTVEGRNEALGNRSQISSEIQSFLSGTDGNGATFGIKSEYRTFFTIWMFITRLPSPSWVDLHPGFLMRGMSYFPVEGSLLGCMYAIVFDFAYVSLGLPASVAAALAVGFGLYLTGCFHEDGLADSADGIGGGWSKSQILKIMTDSRVGTFGCAALSLFLFTKLQLLGSLGQSKWQLYVSDCISSDKGNACGSSGAGPAIITAQMISRLSAPYLIRTRDYVAEVGPKSPFYIFMVEAKYLVSWPRVLFAALYCFGVMSVLYGPIFASMLITSVILLAHLAGKKGEYLLGGVMGDFLGGTICLCEILVLILILAKEPIARLYDSLVDAVANAQEGPEGFMIPIQLVELYKNDLIRPSVHFAILLGVIKIWCTFVGPPDMYNREDGRDEKDGDDSSEKRN